MVAQGTGQALDTGRRGDADVLFVHNKVAEEKFVADGFGVKREEVMYNDFVIVGPKADPAKARGDDVLEGLRRIAAAKSPFASRADKSGTHAAELRYWKAAGIEIERDKGPWYRETGSGMGPTLNTASAMDAYALTDRATWLNFGESRRPRDPRRGRQAPLQPVRRDPREPREARAREKGGQPEIHRLARLARRPGRHRRLQDQRRATLLPERAAAVLRHCVRGRAPDRHPS